MPREYEMRPTYYVEYDEIDKEWCIYVTDYQKHNYDYFIADFKDQEVAKGICYCMNDIMERVWDD